MVHLLDLFDRLRFGLKARIMLMLVVGFVLRVHLRVGVVLGFVPGNIIHLFGGGKRG
jgi:hypothetical protein